MRISDWSSDVCSSDLSEIAAPERKAWIRMPCAPQSQKNPLAEMGAFRCHCSEIKLSSISHPTCLGHPRYFQTTIKRGSDMTLNKTTARSEEHTSEFQSLIHISYAVFCLKKKNKTYTTTP